MEAVSLKAALVLAQLTEPVETNPQPDGLDWAVGIAQILAVVLAAVGARWVYQQVKAAQTAADDARKAAKVERSLGYLGRYAEREFRERVAVVTAYLKVRDVRQCVAHIAAWETAAHSEADCLPRGTGGESAPHARKNDVYEVLDFFEELSAAFRGELVDRDVLMRTLGPVPARFLRLAWWFIAWRRKGESVPTSRLYAELEGMVRLLRKEDPKRFAMAPAVQIRVLAVARRDAPLEDWEQCGRLAEVLDRELANGERRLLESVPEAATGPAPPKPRLELIALPLDLDDPGHAERKATVAELEERLVHLAPGELEAVIEKLGGAPPSPPPPEDEPAQPDLGDIVARAVELLRKGLGGT